MEMSEYFVEKSWFISPAYQVYQINWDLFDLAYKFPLGILMPNPGFVRGFYV